MLWSRKVCGDEYRGAYEKAVGKRSNLTRGDVDGKNPLNVGLILEEDPIGECCV